MPAKGQRLTAPQSMATVGRHFHLCGDSAVLMKDVSCFAATGAARRQSGRSFSIKDAVGMYVTYMYIGFLRGVKKPYPSCLSAATSAGQISKKHSRDTHVNLFFCTKAACLAGLSDRRLRHKHTSFRMFHSKTTLMAHRIMPAFCDKHPCRLSRMPVRNRCSPGS